MSYNGSGAFQINTSGQPVVAATTIDATVFNTLMTDVATGLSTAICKDGQQTITADIPLNAHKLTGVAAATARTDAASLATIQDGTGVYVATVAGTADVITLTPSPAITAYAAGQTFRFIASGANTTNVTVAINGLVAKAITKNGTTALVAGDIASAAMVSITYDGTRFILTATNTAILNSPTISSPTISGTPIFPDNVFTVGGSADATKKLAFEVDGLTTSTTRTLTAQDQDGTIAVTTNLNMNPIINGNMEIWQRGTTFTTGSGTVSADRWKYFVSNAGALTQNRSTNVPSLALAGVLFNYSLELDITTADAAVGAGDFAYISYAIEGNNWRHFAQRACVLSFLVMSSKTGVHAVTLGNAGFDRNLIMEYTVNVADTWELKTVLIPASPSAGTWDFTNGQGIRIAWNIMTGSTNFVTTGSWQAVTTSQGGSANQVNVFDNVANFFRITGVKLELGSVATPIQFAIFQDELARCRRYYQKSFNYATAVAQNAGVNTGEFRWSATIAGAVASLSPRVLFTGPMRTNAPTVTFFNPVAANAQVRNITGAADHSATGIEANSSNEGGFNIVSTGVAGTAVGNSLAVHWSVDNEL